jgi:hypothetical protein
MSIQSVRDSIHGIEREVDKCDCLMMKIDPFNVCWPQDNSVVDFVIYPTTPMLWVKQCALPKHLHIIATPFS